MIVHVFTGSKGGIGKTRCSISLAMYYLFGGVGKPVLKKNPNDIAKKYQLNIYDANSNNIDFFTIMTGKDFQVLAEKNWGTDNNYLRQEFVKINHNKYILPLKGDAYIRKAPFELFKGISDFWNSLAEVVELAKKNKKSGKNEVLIVDSNLAVPNLVSEDPAQKMEMQNIFRKLKKSGVKYILIWYIWCLNDFLSIRENLTFSTSQKIELLNKMCEGDQYPGVTGGGIKQYTLHVLNPYLFFKTSPKFMYFLNRLVSDTAFKEIVDKIDIGFKLPFDMAVKTLVKIIQEIAKKTPGDFSSSWEEVMKKVKEINDKGVNIVLLNDQKENYPYIKERLINIDSNTLMDYRLIHKKNFGEDTIWKKVDEFHKWV